MPTLAQATSKSVEQLGLTPSPALDPPTGRPPIVADPPGLNFDRTPTPASNVTFGTIRTFHDIETTPTVRILAAPQLSEDTGQGNTTVTNVVGGGGAGTSTGGGGGTIVTVPNISKNTAFVTPAISQGQIYQTTISLSAAFLLFQVSVSSPARVELYATGAAQLSDAGRAITTPILLGSSTGLIADFALALPTEAKWLCSPVVVGANGDTPQSPTCYVSVTNLNASTVPITVSFLYLPLE